MSSNICLYTCGGTCFENKQFQVYSICDISYDNCLVSTLQPKREFDMIQFNMIIVRIWWGFAAVLPKRRPSGHLGECWLNFEVMGGAGSKTLRHQSKQENKWTSWDQQKTYSNSCFNCQYMLSEDFYELWGDASRLTKEGSWEINFSVQDCCPTKVFPDNTKL